ncbi:MAG: hypothetical protein SOY64_06010 [Pyramidobacter sp.]|uniref:hypothetical protein n=1 Tax=Pyramidobacter sp. TaxID=1943581 RepID=UPI002A819F7A|nr:hypothetical protein [Pyramidobacter sp.]MDY4032602.1 hypothetical protein [Pyramidobacter sp.]
MTANDMNDLAVELASSGSALEMISDELEGGQRDLKYLSALWVVRKSVHRISQDLIELSEYLESHPQALSGFRFLREIPYDAVMSKPA